MSPHTISEFPDRGTLSLVRGLSEIQPRASRIVRWSKYVKHEDGGRSRKQHLIEHMASIPIVASLVLAKLAKHHSDNRVDYRLVMTAVAVHDVGEALLTRLPEEDGDGNDTLYHAKTDEGDFEEYRAFMESLNGLNEDTREYLERAFLLQFARKNSGVFPERARDIMRELSKHPQEEPILFEAIERWDYFLYALEQYDRQNPKNVQILTDVIDALGPHFDELSSECAGFKEELWTREVRDWCKLFLALHIGFVNEDMPEHLLWRSGIAALNQSDIFAS